MKLCFQLLKACFVAYSVPSAAGPVPAMPPSKCQIDENTNYNGPKILNGLNNIQPSVGACCDSCNSHPDCNVW